MDEHELRTLVAEILQVAPEELREEVELDCFQGYDSAGRLSLMVCLSDFTGKPVKLQELQKIRTYGDVVELVRSSSRNGRSS